MRIAFLIIVCLFIITGCAGKKYYFKDKDCKTLGGIIWECKDLVSTE